VSVVLFVLGIDAHDEIGQACEVFQLHVDALASHKQDAGRRIVDGVEPVSNEPSATGRIRRLRQWTASDGFRMNAGLRVPAVPRPDDRV